MNILSNAVDALEQTASNSSASENVSAKGQISISTRFTRRGKFSKLPCVVIRIVDNGPGIPSAVKEKLFDPFFTTKPVGKGTGLGLSISYQIVVERHGGIVKCFSEPGQGTEFWIEIPTCDVPSGSFETHSLPAPIGLETEGKFTAKSDFKTVTYQDVPSS
jgi:signal transduction histidine kinase